MRGINRFSLCIITIPAKRGDCVMGAVKWRIETGVCPYGHPIEDCMSVTVDKRRPEVKIYRCSIHRRQQQRGLYVPGHINEKNGEPTGKPARVGPGTRVYGQDPHMVDMILVCTHHVVYDRLSLTHVMAKYPGDMYCGECNDWKKVHQRISHIAKDSMEFYPLDVVPLPIPKHEKNAGYGKA